MKPALIIASITGGLVLAGAAAVGSVYLLAHRPAPTASRPVAELAAPPTSPSPVTERVRPVRRHHLRRLHLAQGRRLCPIPASYRAPPPRPVRPIYRTRLHVLTPVYAAPAVYGVAPRPEGWRPRPYWREPRWEGPQRWDEDARRGYGRGDRGPWGGW